MPNDNLITEEQIPSNWEDVEAKPSGAPAPPVPHDMPQFFSGSMPPQLQHDASFVSTEVGSPRIPKHALMPFGIQSNPSTNAAIQSTATKTIQATPTTAPAAAITLNVPNIFTPVTQTVNLPGPLGFTLATEPIGTIFKTPSPGLTSLNGFFANSYSNPSVSAQARITFTPATTGWAFYMESLAGNTSSAPTGWTSWGVSGSLVVSSTAPISASTSPATSLSWCNNVLTFSGTRPTFVNVNSATFSLGTNGGIATLTINPTAGNYLIVSIFGTVGNTGNFTSVTVSDNAGDGFIGVARASASGSNFNGPVTLNNWVVPGCTGGSTTITGAVSGKFPGGSGVTMQVIEVSPFTVNANVLPVFQPLASSDIPGINAGQIAGGLLATNWGGTGSDMHLTGGPNKFVAQFTAGAGFTAVQPDFSNLAGLAGNLATSYNGIPLVSNGIPTITGQVNNTTALANIALSSLLVVGASGAGLYRVSGYVIVNRVATTSSTLPDLNLQWTDQDNSTVQNLTFVATTPSANTLTTMFQFTAIISVKASTNIQYQTGDSTPYASVGATQMQYSVRLRAEPL